MPPGLTKFSHACCNGMGGGVSFNHSRWYSIADLLAWSAPMGIVNPLWAWSSPMWAWSVCVGVVSPWDWCPGGKGMRVPQMDHDFFKNYTSVLLCVCYMYLTCVYLTCAWSLVFSGVRQCLAHALMEVVPLSSKAHAGSRMDGGEMEWSCIPNKSLERVQELVNTGHVDR